MPSSPTVSPSACAWMHEREPDDATHPDTPLHGRPGADVRADRVTAQGLHPIRPAPPGHEAPLGQGARGRRHLQRPHHETGLRGPRARGTHQHQTGSGVRRRTDPGRGDQDPPPRTGEGGPRGSRPGGTPCRSHRGGAARHHRRDAAIRRDRRLSRRIDMTERPVISLEDVRKSYGNFELGPIDLEVEPGHIVAIVGPNGSGKSTLFGTLMNLTRPDLGNVALFGRTYPRDEVEIKRRVSYVPERATGHDEMSANSLGAFVSHSYPRWDRVLYRDLLMRYEVDPYKKFGHLSRGVQRRLSFALALAASPDLLLLDEPTAGVDPFGRKKILEDISRFVHRDAGVKTVVFATQVMEEAMRIADHMVLLTNGESLACTKRVPSLPSSIGGRPSGWKGSRGQTSPEPPKSSQGAPRASLPTRRRRPQNGFPPITYGSSVKGRWTWRRYSPTSRESEHREASSVSSSNSVRGVDPFPGTPQSQGRSSKLHARRPSNA